MRPTVWDDVADSFHDSVLSPLGYDRSGLLKKMVIACGGTGRSAIDLGCGVGRWLPLLAGEFDSVVAVDFSAKCLESAARRYPSLRNVRYLKRDLGSRVLNFGQKFHLAVLCNSLLDGDQAHRRRTMISLSRILRPDGVALLVVPSLESFLYTRSLEARGKRVPSKSRKIATMEGVIAEKSFLNFMRTGAVDVDGEPTKYFLQPEILDLVRSVGLATRTIFRLEYPWSAVSYKKMPRDTSSQPWDWALVVAKRGARKFPGMFEIEKIRS